MVTHNSKNIAAAVKALLKIEPADPGHVETVRAHREALSVLALLEAAQEEEPNAPVSQEWIYVDDGVGSRVVIDGVGVSAPYRLKPGSGRCEQQVADNKLIASAPALRRERDELRGKLESLQGEVVGAITDAGGAMLENNPCAPGETASAIARLAGKLAQARATIEVLESDCHDGSCGACVKCCAQAEKQRDEAAGHAAILLAFFGEAKTYDEWEDANGNSFAGQLKRASDSLATIKGGEGGVMAMKCPECKLMIEWDYEECQECLGGGRTNGVRCDACQGAGERRFALPCDCDDFDDPEDEATRP